MTFPEVLLWRALRQRPSGLKFRRQHPAGAYILDFFCAARKLAVEVDGEAHNRGDRPARDERRDQWLSQQGIVICRVSAMAVLDDLDAVVRLIVTSALGEVPLHQPSAGPPPLAGED